MEKFRKSRYFSTKNWFKASKIQELRLKSQPAVLLYTRIPSPTCEPPSSLWFPFCPTGPHLTVYTPVEKISEHNNYVFAGEEWQRDSPLKRKAGLRFFGHTTTEELDEVNHNTRIQRQKYDMKKRNGLIFFRLCPKALVSDRNERRVGYENVRQYLPHLCSYGINFKMRIQRRTAS